MNGRFWRTSWQMPNNLGMLLLSVWLITSGMMTLLRFTFPHSGIVMATLAVATGVVILFDVRRVTLFLVVLLVIAVGFLILLIR